MRDGVSFRATDDSNRPAASTPAKEMIFAIGFEPRDSSARRHFDLLEHFPRRRINLSYVAFIALPRAMPKLSVGPRDSGDKAI
jgi:hypothetical protein